MRLKVPGTGQYWWSCKSVKLVKKPIWKHTSKCINSYALWCSFVFVWIYPKHNQTVVWRMGVFVCWKWPARDRSGNMEDAILISLNMISTMSPLESVCLGLGKEGTNHCLSHLCPCSAPCPRSMLEKYGECVVLEQGCFWGFQGEKAHGGCWGFIIYAFTQKQVASELEER